LRDKDGDILLSGAIQRYEVAPVNIGSAGSAAQNRLTMSVRVVYENRVRPAEGWEESFSTFVDFPQSESLASVQNQLNQELNQQLATDIFNRAFGNW
jgi:hypothetical protein